LPALFDSGHFDRLNRLDAKRFDDGFRGWKLLKIGARGPIGMVSEAPGGIDAIFPEYWS
jgi:hypothetical protein